MTTQWLSSDEQRVWRNFLRLHFEMQAELARDMAAVSDLSMADYGVLVALTDVPEGRLRISEVADQLSWERSRVSHQLKRMATRGLVERSECVEDGRGSFVGITAEGRRAIEKAAPAHVDSVRRLFVDRLDGEELAALSVITGKLLDGLS